MTLLGFGELGKGRAMISEWKERACKSTGSDHDPQDDANSNWHRWWGDTCDSGRAEGLTCGGKCVVVAHIPHKATKDGVISHGVGTHFTFQMSCFCYGNTQGEREDPSSSSSSSSTSTSTTTTKREGQGPLVSWVHRAQWVIGSWAWPPWSWVHA